MKVGFLGAGKMAEAILAWMVARITGPATKGGERDA